MKLPTEERRGPLFTAVFARAAAPVMREDLAPIIDRVRPDLVVRETAELAAAPMAAARGIPLVTVAFSGVLPERARGQVVDALRPLWQAEGLGDPSWADVYGQLYLHPFPVSFGQRPDSTVVRPIRPDRGSPSAAPAAWVASLGVDRPFVYVTAGTEPPSVTFPWRELFAVLGGLDVDAVATIGPHVDPAALGAVPPNIRVERFVPQGDLLGRASAVVSHGGAGTVLGAASHGRPQLVVPLFADQWENGVAVDDAGCGIVLGPTGAASTTSSRRCVPCSPTRRTVRPPLGSPTRSPRCRPRPIWHPRSRPSSRRDRRPRSTSPGESDAPVTDDGRSDRGRSTRAPQPRLVACRCRRRGGARGRAVDFCGGQEGGQLVGAPGSGWVVPVWRRFPWPWRPPVVARRS